MHLELQWHIAVWQLLPCKVGKSVTWLWWTLVWGV